MLFKALPNPLSAFFKDYRKLLVVSAIILYTLYKRYKKKSVASILLMKAVAKRRQRDLTLNQPLPPLKISLEKQQLILNSPVHSLLKMLNNDETTSEEVLLVFCQRVRTIGLNYELIADVNFEEALDMARACDEKRKATPQEERAKLGLLYGIPFSVKDNFKLKGLDATFGLASRCFQPQDEDAVLIGLLKKNGAIPFVKSSGPQMMMTIETVNHIWGRAKNPWNPERTVGGSSGGEGGLLAARCSPLGIGTDIGGSVRIPALYCGVYGIKPTAERLSAKGLIYPNQVGRNGNTLIRTVAGPLGKCTEDLRTMMKVLVSEELVHMDPKVARVDWDNTWEEKPMRKLKIGYIENDDFFEVSLANKRAVRETCEALVKQGHEVVSLEGLMPSFQRAQEIYSGIFTAEGKLRSFFQALQGEPIIKEYDQWVLLAFMPPTIRHILAKLLNFMGQKRSSNMLQHSGEKKTHELFEYTKQLEGLKEEIISMWKQNNLDAIITPGMALPAVLHGEAHSLYINACYTMLWNLINFPTGVLPITKILPTETVYKNPQRKNQGDQYDKLAQACLKDAAGLPVGVQISTLPFEEEKCLAIMSEVEKQIQFYEHPI